jgi:hypothetical protein
VEIPSPNPNEASTTEEQTPWQVNPAIAEKASKELYFQFIHPKEIVRLTGVPMNALKTWIFDSWKNERDEIIDSDLSRVKSTVKSYSLKLNQICRDSLDILADNIRYLKHEEAKLSLDEMRTLSAILGDIDKLARLEDGKPTSIIMSSFNQSDVLNLIHDLQTIDPFCDYVIDDETSELGNSYESPLQTSRGNEEEPSVLGDLSEKIESLEREVEAPRLSDESPESDIQLGEKEGIH